MTIIDMIPTTRTAPPPASPPDTITACMIIEIARARFNDGRGRANGGNPWGGALTCRYRDEQGTPCVVGAMITDDEYSLSLEGVGVMCLVPGPRRDEFTVEHRNREVGMLPARLWPHVRLLVDLQNIHDVGCMWTDGRLNDRGLREFERVAQRYGCS